jgi:hypothetical protein
VRNVERSQGAEAADEPRGIGGWLLLVAVLEGAILFKLIVVLERGYQEPETLSAFKQYPLAMYGELTLNMFIVLLALAATILLFLRSRYFPRFFICQLVAIVVVPVLSTIWTALTLSSPLSAPFHELVAFEPSEWIELAVGVGQALLGIPYVLRSKRVRNTFDGRGYALLPAVVFIVAASGLFGGAAGLGHVIGRGVFSGQLVGGSLQIALAVWLYRGSEIARLILVVLFALGVLFAIAVAFYASGDGAMGVVIGSVLAAVCAVVFWILAFSKRLQAELAIKEAKYRKPELEAA